MPLFTHSTTFGSETLSNLPVPDSFGVLWEQLLTHSTGGLVGLTAIRENDQPDAPIIDFQYQFLNEVARRDTQDQQPDSKEPIVGARFSTYFPSIRQTTLWKAYLDVVATGQARRVEQHYRIGKRDIQITQSVVPLGSDGLLLTYADPSDLQQLTRRLAHQTILLNGVIHSSPNAILVFDAIRDASHNITDFQVTLTNQQFSRLTHQHDVPMIGQFLSAIYPLTPDQFDKLKRLVAEGGNLVVDKYVATYNRWLFISLTTLNDGFVATVQDVSADRQMRRQLEQMVQELHQSNQSLEQFAYVASHDLQEPLRKIVSFSEMLNTQFAADMSTDAADLIQRMHMAADRMRSLVSDLLNYARLSGTRATFRPIDLNQLLALVTDDLEFAIDEKQAQIQIDPLPTVQGDVLLLRQLFQNLISNGLKFQPTTANAPAPTVRIGGTVPHPDTLPDALRIHESGTHRPSYAWITVADNGIGFDEKYLNQIFNIFQRLHGRSHYTGTGMGLAICKKVADIHGGYITANSQEGNGTVFHVYLPVT